MDSSAKLETGIPLEIPLVDFSPYLYPTSTPSQRLGTAEELVQACHDVGFVTLANHGVSSALLGEAFAWSKRLFNLSMEEKMLAPHPVGWSVHRGYSWPGLEKVTQDESVEREGKDVRDCKESYEIGHPGNQTQPNIWMPPEVLPGFEEFMGIFYETLSATALLILEALALGLGLSDPGKFLKPHSGMNNQLRLLHYPLIAARELEEGSSARMEAHSDWGSTTLLFQDECGGLEVQRKDGGWRSVVPVEGALVMNIGDLLMRWSNDYLKSTLHRVVLPPLNDRFTGPERMTRARYAIPYFVAPDENTLVEVFKESTNVKNPAKYEAVTQKEYTAKRARLQY
ncbi:hypothetical protein LZ554_007291 [Drepanopeziza brunnea f. sp. 'monogermtubi']|nr:hypothetical protein LZ554_007291 [Drepanopeziza brunnea f. sp. 'monogermtubi']